MSTPVSVRTAIVHPESLRNDSFSTRPGLLPCLTLISWALSGADVAVTSALFMTFGLSAAIDQATAIAAAAAIPAHMTCTFVSPLRRLSLAIAFAYRAPLQREAVHTLAEICACGPSADCERVGRGMGTRAGRSCVGSRVVQLDH
jgi:hypothetical protein